MKKFLCLLLSCIGVIACAAETNLVKNPDFAHTYAPGKASYWSMSSKTAVFKPGTAGGVMELAANNKHSALLQEMKFSCDQDVNLTMSFEYCGTANINGTLHAVGADGKELKIKGRNCKSTASSEFKTISSKLVIPAGTRQLRIALRCYGEGKATFKTVKLIPVKQ